MKEILKEIIKTIDELSRAVERGDVNLSDLREQLLKVYQKIDLIN